MTKPNRTFTRAVPSHDHGNADINLSDAHKAANIIKQSMQQDEARYQSGRTQEHEQPLPQ